MLGSGGAAVAVNAASLFLESIPLKRYYSASRQDSFTTATAEGDQAARIAGYKLTGQEGYVLRNELPGSVALKMYYSDQRSDSFTTATAAGEREALAAGYVFVRVEGYVLDAMPVR